MTVAKPDHKYAQAHHHSVSPLNTSADRLATLQDTHRLENVGGLAHRQLEKAVGCGWVSPGCH